MAMNSATGHRGVAQAIPDTGAAALDQTTGH